jgi:hypothetical protein
MQPREERIKKQNELLALHPAVREELMKIPGVYDVAVGVKEVNNQITDEIVFQVFVDKKINEQELKTGEIIPKEIKGIKTDVQLKHHGAVLRGFFDGPEGDKHKYETLKAGIMVGFGIEGGTLGCFAKLKKDNSLVILSNAHVLVGDRDENALIGQPQYNRRCCCCCAYDEFRIGVVIGKGFDDQKIDAAIARVDAGIPHEAIINNNARGNSITLHIKGVGDAIAFDKVKKIGKLSGHTLGIITTINGTVEKAAPDGADRIGQIFIKPDPSEKFVEFDKHKRAFSDGGDSGSVVLNEKDQIVGLLWGGNPEVDPQVDVSYACHIKDVLEAFKAKDLELIIEDSPATTSSSLVQSAKIETAGIVVRPELEIQEKFSQTGEGKLLLKLFRAHQEEVLNLINHERTVTVAWQRNQGPAFAAHLVKSAQDPSYIIPQVVENISLQQLFTNMATVLKAKGSGSLQNDIDQFGPEIIDYASGLSSVNEIFSRINQKAIA